MRETKEYISNITLPNGETKYIKDSELTNRVTNDESDVSSLKTNVQTNTNNITTLKTNVQTNTDDITTLKTNVQTNTDDITTLKTNVQTNTDDISNLNEQQINFNLLSTTQNFNPIWRNISSWTKDSDKVILDNWDFTSYHKSTSWQGLGYYNPVPKGTYTFSFYAKGSENTTVSVGYSVSSTYHEIQAVSIGTVWSRYAVTFTTNSTVTFLSIAPLSDNIVVSLCGYKLEKGTKSTPWFLSENDIQVLENSISTNHTNINSLQTSVNVLNQEVPRNIVITNFATYNIDVTSSSTSHLDGLITYNSSEGTEYFVGHLYLSFTSSNTLSSGNTHICKLPSSFTYDNKTFTCEYTRGTETVINDYGATPNVTSFITFSPQYSTISYNVPTNKIIGGNWTIPLEIKLQNK